MPRRERALRVDRKDPLALEIQAVLEEDLANGAKLMQPKYREAALKHRSLDGYCAVASAAYFFLGGGREAGLQPMQLTRAPGSHWWIVKNGSTIIDLTLRPRERIDGYPYENGTARGFLQTGYKGPSARAAKLIALVERRRRDQARRG